MVDNRFIESHNFQLRYIARAFDVPPYKLAIEGGMEGPAMVQLGQQCLNGPISGYCDRWKAKTEQFYELDGDDTFLDWGYGHFLKADLLSRGPVGAPASPTDRWEFSVGGQPCLYLPCNQRCGKLGGMTYGDAATQTPRSARHSSDRTLIASHHASDQDDADCRVTVARDNDGPAQNMVDRLLHSNGAPADRTINQPPPFALEITGLAKHFERPAVDGLDLSVRTGEFYTLLGPNGAGKTTTMRMVAGLLTPDRGSIAVFGIDALTNPIGAKRIMAWVSDEPMIYDKLTPMEYLAFVAGLWAVDGNLAAQRAHNLLSSFGLEPHALERCEKLSKGMRQKVALAGALVHDPKLIILDEPLTGLDAGSARMIKGVLRARVESGCSVIMTTHILDVAERMADRIGVMAGGVLIAEGTLDELRRQAGSGHGSLEDTFLALVEQGTASA